MFSSSLVMSSFWPLMAVAVALPEFHQGRHHQFQDDQLLADAEKFVLEAMGIEL